MFIQHESYCRHLPPLEVTNFTRFNSRGSVIPPKGNGCLEVILGKKRVFMKRKYISCPSYISYKNYLMCSIINIFNMDNMAQAYAGCFLFGSWLSLLLLNVEDYHFIYYTIVSINCY